MEYVLVSNYENVTYAGEPIAGGLKEEYIVIKPNKKLNFAVAFRTCTIQLLVFADGRKEWKEVQGVNQDEPEIQDSIMVRMLGGVSFRGTPCECPVKEWSQNDGFWLAPMKDKNLVFWIPENEIIRKFER